MGDHDDDAVICAHDANIKSINMKMEGKCVDMEKVDNWLSEMLWADQYQQPNDDDTDENKENEENKQHEHKMDIYRMKAVLPGEDGMNYFLSSVQDLYEIEEGNTKWTKPCLCKM